MLKTLRLIFLAGLLWLAAPSYAQREDAAAAPTAERAGAEAEHDEGPAKPFDAHMGTWINPLARAVFGLEPIKSVGIHEGDPHVFPKASVQRDFLVLALLIMGMVGFLGVAAGKQVKIRPDGKPTSIANAVEAAVEGFRNYLVGIMGPELANKYAPLISSYFFTILFMNYAGLIPGLMSPTANPNVPIGLALVALIAVHGSVAEIGYRVHISVNIVRECFLCLLAS